MRHRSSLRSEVSTNEGHVSQCGFNLISRSTSVVELSEHHSTASVSGNVQGSSQSRDYTRSVHCTVSCRSLIFLRRSMALTSKTYLSVSWSAIDLPDTINAGIWMTVDLE